MTPFDNNFFGEDPFESIIRDFFGKSSVSNGRRNTIIKGEEEDRNIDFIEDNNYIYLVFELNGYNEQDVSVLVKGKDLEIKAKKSEEICDLEKVQSYLNQKLCKGIFIKKILPKFINPKKFKYNLKNGVLEIIFSKK